MAYKNGKRTVFCRQCYQAGHNRRGCPTLSPEVKAMYKTGDRARRCSYCSEKGHTKRKCEKRTVDMAEYIKENAAYRQTMLDNMVATGLSLGCLMVSEDESMEKLTPDDLSLVTEIAWDEIQAKKKSARTVKCMRINAEPNSYYSDVWYSLPRPDKQGYSWGHGKVINKRDDIMKHVPDGWLKGISGADKFF